MKAILGVVLVELLLNIAIIYKVSYTEIDWKAYMSEVFGFWSGDWNYKHLCGDTGPLVYPAGFLYIFGTLFQSTNGGENQLTAQFLFAGIYCLTLLFVLLIYRETVFSQATTLENVMMILFLILSKRIHSIFVLRLFNDGVCMLFLYAALYALIKKKWVLASFLWSVAFSIKMNAILFLPGLLVVLTLHHGLIMTFIKYIPIMGATQFLVAIPFLLENPTGYLSRSFSTSRTFLMKWSVNMKFLPEDVFYSSIFGKVLLITQITLLFVFALKWCNFDVWGALKGGQSLQSVEIIKILFTSNIIGIICMKSLHYQFYVWYFHSLPFLMFVTKMNKVMQILVWIGIEVAWNIYPSTPWSSLILQVCHLVLLTLLIKNG